MTRPRKGEVVPGLGAHLRGLRGAIGLTQERLAEASGVKVETISRIETGVNTPDLDTLSRLALALGQPIFAMFPAPEARDAAMEPDDPPTIALLVRWRALSLSDRLLVLGLLERLLTAGGGVSRG
jgi:transcriptional regulator with XRE-family HTH domain